MTSDRTSCYLRHPQWELLEMDLILLPIALGALAGCPSTSQKESFHISFTLHIYYIIFFIKNQIRTFVQNGVSTLHKAVVFPLAHLPMPDTLLGTTILDVQDGVWHYAALTNWATPPYQGAETPLSSSPTPPCQVNRWGRQDSNLRPAAPQASQNCCYRLYGLEKVVWSWKVIRAYYFSNLTYIL